MPDFSSPSVADVERIRAVGDPVLRNLQITQCYHELSAAMAGRTGPGANWCTFATWASKQAGQTIRREDLARTLESAFGDSPEVASAVEKVILLARQIRSGIDPGKINKLHFIVDLFRCYHETRELHAPPFTDEQVNDIQRGRLPGGRL